jgi:hypothetical protein
MILGHVPSDAYASVVAAMEEVLQGWLDYRDDVAHACGLTRESETRSSDVRGLRTVA